MNLDSVLWAPPPIPSLPVEGLAQRMPVNRLFFGGRNYYAHAIEMGRPVDKSLDSPFYFTKSPSTLVPTGSTIDYPPGTRDFHFEMELVVAIGAAGLRVPAVRAHELIYGYACGLDMTRRDLQLAARDKGRPWDVGKDVEQSSVVSQVVPRPGQVLGNGRISLAVNGEMRQQSDLGRLIWNVREIIEDLSRYYHLLPGDLIFTGTPEGVGPVVTGDRLDGHIDGIGAIELTIGPAAG